MKPKEHTGDDGKTGWLGEGRLPKYDLRMETLGALDETNSALGLARNYCQDALTADILMRIQRAIYGLMGEAAADKENASRFRVITQKEIDWLDEQEETLIKMVELPKEFIVPGDSIPGAFLDMARTIVRRAERRVAAMVDRGDIENPYLLPYLNRVSTLCFMLELLENTLAGKLYPTLAKNEESHDRNNP